MRCSARNMTNSVLVGYGPPLTSPRFQAAAYRVQMPVEVHTHGECQSSRVESVPLTHGIDRLTLRGRRSPDKC